MLSPTCGGLGRGRARIATEASLQFSIRPTKRHDDHEEAEDETAQGGDGEEGNGQQQAIACLVCIVHRSVTAGRVGAAGSAGTRRRCRRSSADTDSRSSTGGSRRRGRCGSCDELGSEEGRGTELIGEPECEDILLALTHEAQRHPNQPTPSHLTSFPPLLTTSNSLR